MRPPRHVRERWARRRARLRRLGYDSYGAYLGSPHWLQLRASYRESDLPQGCICGETDVQLHHMTYERIGAERLTDLTPLCTPCHALVHELERRRQLPLDLDGLCDEGRAAEGRALLNAMAAEARCRREQALADEQREVLALSYAARLLRVARRAKYERHFDVGHELFVIKQRAAKGVSDETMTRLLRRLEERVYGWDGWGEWSGTR